MSNDENPTPAETTATESCAACGGPTSGLPFCERCSAVSVQFSAELADEEARRNERERRAMVLGHTLHPQLSSVVRISVDPSKIGHRIADIGRFAEKPNRDVLEALRAAEYRYGAGAWVGKLDRLPAAVLELEAASR